MPISVVMPALEMAQDTGKLISWRKQEGETVTKGEILLEVETDKAVVEVEAQAGGVLAGVKAKPGDVIPVGRTIAWILRAGESVPVDEVPVSAPGDGAGHPPSTIPHAIQSSSETRAGAKKIKISPKARRVAQERGVDIEHVRGSGGDGEILVSDIVAAAEPAEAAATTKSSATVASLSTSDAAPGAQALSSIGRLMAERTTQSWTSVPHFFLTRECEASGLNASRARLSKAIEEARGVRLSHTDLLISVVARALEHHPRLNASWTGQAIRFNQEINIGVAMAVEEGVVAGVVRSANKIELAEIAVQRRDLADRARAGRLRPDDIAGATFTISNLGMYHVNAFTAIIVPPQAAILAVGEIEDRVIAVEGKPAVRPMITLTLSCDHRVVDGARAAEFMDTVASSTRSEGHHR
ncbi:MAG TPA: dihydrolipoamide acetyltransferase family protein [Candidatus Acidoferrales bacterium]|nr:dihydrolipoamide acetyltransferase family protein [Candidatus Acidoferrales bacterium]